MTAFYTFRVIFLSFFGGPRMSKEVAHHIHESPPVMTVPLIVLSLLTIVAGLAVGIPSSHGTAFERFLAPVLPRHEAEHSSGTAFALLVVSVLFVFAGIAVAWVMYGRREVRPERIGVPRNAIHALVLNNTTSTRSTTSSSSGRSTRDEWCAPRVRRRPDRGSSTASGDDDRLGLACGGCRPAS